MKSILGLKPVTTRWRRFMLCAIYGAALRLCRAMVLRYVTCPSLTLYHAQTDLLSACCQTGSQEMGYYLNREMPGQGRSNRNERELQPPRE
jgi:hypothetical protein